MLHSEQFFLGTSWIQLAEGSIHWVSEHLVLRMPWIQFNIPPLQITTLPQNIYFLPWIRSLNLSGSSGILIGVSIRLYMHSWQKSSVEPLGELIISRQYSHTNTIVDDLSIIITLILVVSLITYANDYIKIYKAIIAILYNMYRLIPMRMLRRTSGVIFDEMVPSDIPKIHGIDKVIHAANSI